MHDPLEDRTTGHLYAMQSDADQDEAKDRRTRADNVENFFHRFTIPRTTRAATTAPPIKTNCEFCAHQQAKVGFVAHNAAAEALDPPGYDPVSVSAISDKTPPLVSAGDCAKTGVPHKASEGSGKSEQQLVAHAGSPFGLNRAHV
jgi:hypothetical protein